jgi:DNA-binding Xre family transcriptional regulator
MKVEIAEMAGFAQATFNRIEQSHDKSVTFETVTGLPEF